MPHAHANWHKLAGPLLECVKVLSAVHWALETMHLTLQHSTFVVGGRCLELRRSANTGNFVSTALVTEPACLQN